MAYYDKKVVYLSEMEYGSKIKGAGFVRMEFRDDACSLDIHITGMPEVPDDKYDICVVSVWGEEHRAGMIYLHNGKAQWQGRYEDGKGLEIAQIVIKVSNGRTICGSTGIDKGQVKAAQLAQQADGNLCREWEQSPADTDIGDARRSGKGDGEYRDNIKGGGNRGHEKWRWGEIPGRRWEFRRSELKNREEENEIAYRKDMELLCEDEMKQGGKEEQGSKEEQGKEEQDLNLQKESGKQQNNGANAIRTVMGRQVGGKEEDVSMQTEHRNTSKINPQNFFENNREIEMDAVILNDKWDQLCQIYQVVHPYEDEREYISIQPKDFVIMTGDYQHLANNSFLLHGFYNYRHIILGREPDSSFYLGVPGVYYEREKMVALMFGFEAFECKGGSAEAGRFGYYLRKVKI